VCNHPKFPIFSNLLVYLFLRVKVRFFSFMLCFTLFRSLVVIAFVQKANGNSKDTFCKEWLSTFMEIFTGYKLGIMLELLRPKWRGAALSKLSCSLYAKLINTWRDSSSELRKTFCAYLRWKVTSVQGENAVAKSPFGDAWSQTKSGTITERFNFMRLFTLFWFAVTRDKAPVQTATWKFVAMRVTITRGRISFLWIDGGEFPLLRVAW